MTHPDAEEEREVNVQEYRETLPPSTLMSEEESVYGMVFPSSFVDVGLTVM